MFSRIRARLTYANVVATLALFFALGGASAYAINEWTGANIKDETLTGADIKGTNATSSTAGVNGTIKGADVYGQPSNFATGQPFVDGGLSTWDLADGTVQGRDLKNDTLG